MQAASNLLPATPTVDELKTALTRVERQRLAANPAVLQVRFTAMPKVSRVILMVSLT